MKTRRQARLEAAADEVPSLRKKNQMIKGKSSNPKQIKKTGQEPKKKVKR